MALQIPLSGATPAAGGVMLTPEQGRVLVNGVLDQTGAVNLAGDRLTTNKRKTTFPIILGEPQADLVGEGAPKPVTGMEFAETELNIRKVATIVPFTDELLDDLASEPENDEVTSEVDRRVRRAIARRIDALIVGKQNGADYAPVNGFDDMLRESTASVEYDAGTQDGLRKAVSAGMSILEDNGYDDEAQMGLLLSSGVKRHLRDARKASDATDQLYKDEDPFYNIDPEYSHNLNRLSAAAAIGSMIGAVVYKPNLHFRIRTDVRVKMSTDAVINDGVQERNAFQEDLTFLRFETRQGFMIHDRDRAVVKIGNAA